MSPPTDTHMSSDNLRKPDRSAVGRSVRWCSGVLASQRLGQDPEAGFAPTAVLTARRCPGSRRLVRRRAIRSAARRPGGRLLRHPAAARSLRHVVVCTGGGARSVRSCLMFCPPGNGRRSSTGCGTVRTFRPPSGPRASRCGRCSRPPAPTRLSHCSWPAPTPTKSVPPASRNAPSICGSWLWAARPASPRRSSLTVLEKRVTGAETIRRSRGLATRPRNLAPGSPRPLGRPVSPRAPACLPRPPGNRAVRHCCRGPGRDHHRRDLSAP